MGMISQYSSTSTGDVSPVIFITSAHKSLQQSYMLGCGVSTSADISLNTQFRQSVQFIFKFILTKHMSLSSPRIV